MSIDQIDVIDFTAFDISRDAILLVISDHLVWDGEDDHILLVEDKINTYLQFIENGQADEMYPEAKDKQIIIEIKAKYFPDSRSLTFLNSYKEQLEAIGIKFEWNTLII
jgi:hypothetical protein